MGQYAEGEGGFGEYEDQIVLSVLFEDCSFPLCRTPGDYMYFYSTEQIQERFKAKAPTTVRDEALAADTPMQYTILENKQIQKYKARYAG